MRRFICLLMLLCGRCFAVQYTPPAVNPNPSSDDANIFEQINEELRHSSPKQSADGWGNVDSKRAAICEICKQPLSKHADAGFECIPLDPRTGEQRVMLRIHTVGVTCPVCAHSFIGALPGNINDQAG